VSPYGGCGNDDYFVDDLATVARESGIALVTLRREIWAGRGPPVTWLSPRRMGVQRRHRREWLEARSGNWRPAAEVIESTTA
jgi:hypothetical protein